LLVEIRIAIQGVDLHCFPVHVGTPAFVGRLKEEDSVKEIPEEYDAI
jgi:hypothetical protein